MHGCVDGDLRSFASRSPLHKSRRCYVRSFMFSESNLMFYNDHRSIAAHRRVRALSRRYSGGPFAWAGLPPLQFCAIWEPARSPNVMQRRQLVAGGYALTSKHTISPAAHHLPRHQYQLLWISAETALPWAGNSNRRSNPRI